MNDGEYARIVYDPVCRGLIGMAGRLTGIKEFNGKEFFILIAENYGPRIPGRNVLSWKRGDRRTVAPENIAPIE